MSTNAEVLSPSRDVLMNNTGPAGPDDHSDIFTYSYSTVPNNPMMLQHAHPGIPVQQQNFMQPSQPMTTVSSSQPPPQQPTSQAYNFVMQPVQQQQQPLFSHTTDQFHQFPLHQQQTQQQQYPSNTNINAAGVAPMDINMYQQQQSAAAAMLQQQSSHQQPFLQSQSQPQITTTSAVSSSTAQGPQAQTTSAPAHIAGWRPRPNNARLIIKLTIGLMTTYNNINDKYYANKRKKQQEEMDKERERQRLLAAQGGKYNDGFDDKDYNYIIQPNEKLNRRYVVDSNIGKGSFGRVVRAYDKVDKAWVAVKIVKSKSAFYKQAQVEISILNSLQDNADKWNIVTLKDTFMHHNHQCIVFELLSINLYELLRNTKFQGVSLKLISKFAFQLLCTLGHLSSGDRGEKRIIHCDLKPENILLRNPKKSAIKVIDFGSACFLEDHQVLTELGWMNIEQLRKLEIVEQRDGTKRYYCQQLPERFSVDKFSLGVDQYLNRPLHVAKYNPISKQLEYVELTNIIERTVEAGGELVNMRGGDGNEIDVTVTTDHDMYVAEQEMRSYNEYGYGAVSCSNPTNYVKIPAAHLFANSQRSTFRVFVNSENGVHRSGLGREFYLFKQLGLNSDGEINGFLKLYAFWICHGSIDNNNSEVIWRSKDESQTECLLNCFHALNWAIEGDTSRNVDCGKTYVIRAGSNGFHLRSSTSNISKCWVEYFISSYGFMFSRGLHTLTESKWFQILKSVYGEGVGVCESDTRISKWFDWWVFSLSIEQVRTMLEGLVQAHSKNLAHNTKPYQVDIDLFAANSVERDQCIQLCAHAGWSAFYGSNACNTPFAHAPVDNSDVLVLNRNENSIMIRSPSHPTGCLRDAQGLPIRDMNGKCQYGVGPTLITKQQVDRDTKVWCVTAGTAGDGIILVRRVYKDNKRKKCSRPIWIGNCFANQKTYTYIQSRFYRAPEVLLNLPYNGAIDMWSLGCILVEMHTGRPIFDGLNEADQMMKQVEILGNPPRWMLDRNKKAEKFFDYDKSNDQWLIKRKLSNNKPSIRTAMGSKWQNTPLYVLFEDFILKMLTYSPKHRIKPSQALLHPFLTTAAQVTSLYPSTVSSPSTSISSTVSSSTIGNNNNNTSTTAINNNNSTNNSATTNSIAHLTTQSIDSTISASTLSIPSTTTLSSSLPGQQTVSYAFTAPAVQHTTTQAAPLSISNPNSPLPIHNSSTTQIYSSAHNQNINLDPLDVRWKL